MVIPALGEWFKDFKNRKKTVIVRLVMIVGLCFCLGFSFYDDYGVDKIKKMNTLVPSTYGYLTEIVENPENVDTKRLKSYLKYYKAVSKYIPHRADAYGMKGFCYYYLGNEKKAIVAYKSASARHSDFFWFYYNLGVIYYNSVQYDQAAIYFEKALDADYRNTAQFILASQRIYIPILNSYQRDLNQQIKLEIIEGYQNSRRVLREIKNKQFMKKKMSIKTY